VLNGLRALGALLRFTKGQIDTIIAQAQAEIEKGDANGSAG